MADNVKAVDLKNEASAKDASSASPVIPELVVTLRRPFEYFGTTYKEIDLSGLAKLTAKDGETIDGIIMTRRDVSPAAYSYNHPDFMYVLAQKASGLPFDLFEALPFQSMEDIDIAINDYLQGDNVSDTLDYIARLSDGIMLNGKIERNLDMSGLQDLTGNDIKSAERYASKQPSAKPYVRMNMVRGSQACQFCLASYVLGCTPSVLNALSFRDTVKLRNVVAAFLGRII